MPLLDSARAVISPVHASSESVEDFDQSEREMVAISRGSVQYVEQHDVTLRGLTVGTRCHEEVLPGRMPDRRAVVPKFGCSTNSLNILCGTQSRMSLTPSPPQREERLRSLSPVWARSLKRPTQ